jgi:hypothetical protein
MRSWLLVLALFGCQGWRKQDTALEVAFVGTALVDWHQTISITHDCVETNPMIGNCGDTVTPNLYFPVVLVAHAAIAACLPHTWRTVFLAFTTGIEASTIWGNERAGYEVL